MRSRWTVILLAALLLATQPTPVAAKRGAAKKGVKKAITNVAPRGETVLEKQLQDELDRVLATKLFARARNGVVVIDARTKRVLYSYAAEEQLNPASNVKLVSTSTALDALGPDYRLRTRLLGVAPDKTGVVGGDVYLVGEWDFTLKEAHLADITAGVQERGIRRITGDVVVGDDDARDAPLKASVGVTITGGAREGDLAQVTLDQDSAYFIIENGALTKNMAPRKVAKKVPIAPSSTKGKGKGKKKKKFKTVYVMAPAAASLDVTLREEDSETGPQLVVLVTGRIRPGDTVTLRRSVAHPGLYAAHTVRANLKRAGIAVDGHVRRAAAPPDGLAELGAHESVPLATLVAWVNKPSNNYLADRVIEATGARLYGGAPTNEKGLKAMDAYLAKLGFTAGSYRLDNGSGLSYTNHLSVQQIVDLLQVTSRDTRIGTDFVASLSVAGRDGTLRRRFAGRPSVGFMRGKTGTLTGVAALSGLVSVGSDPDDVILFAIMTNDFPNRRKQEIRAGQAAMVDAMYSFLRRRAESDRPSGLPVVAPPPDEGTVPPPPDEPELDGEPEDDEDPAAASPVEHLDEGAGAPTPIETP